MCSTCSLLAWTFRSVAAMWKFGFPGELSYFGNAVVIKSMSSFFLNNAIPIVLETILLFYSALHDTSTSRAMRSVDSLNAVGTIIHHSSASLAVSALLANGELSRVLLLVYLLLLFLLRRCYSNTLQYCSHKSKSWCSSVHSPLGHAALVYPFAV